MKKALFFIFFSSAIVYGDQFAIQSLDHGMYSYQSANEIPDDSAAYIQNYYTDIDHMAVERNGTVKRDATVLGGTKPVYGLWEFVDVSGNDWIISYSSRTFYKNTIGQTPAAFGLTGTTDQIPDCAITLGKIWCVDGANPMWWFDGTSTGSVSSSPVGTIIEPWRTRLVITNISGSKSTLRFSGDGDGTSWTIGGNATDPFSIQIGGTNDGQYVRCLVGSYLDSMVVGRKYDMWAIDGFDQSDITVRNISNIVGCIEPRTPKEVDGELVFLSARGLEAMDGRNIRLISDPVRDYTDILVKNTSNQRTNIQTSQTDFEAGASTTNTLSTTYSVGNIQPNIMSATLFVDSTTVSFSSGALTNLTSTTTLRLSYVPDANSFLATTLDNAQCSDSCSSPYYQSAVFLNTSSQVVSSVYIRSVKIGSPSDYTVNLRASDGIYSIGSILKTVTLAASSVTSATSTVKIDFSSSTALAPGATYWIQWVPSGICNPTNNIKIAVRQFVASSTAPFGCGSNGADTGVSYRYTIATTTFTPTGNIVSRVFDVGFTTNSWLWNWSNLTSSANYSSQSITFQTQTATSTNGPFDSLVAVTTGTAITSTVRQFIRYKATLTTTDPVISPSISSVTMMTSQFQKSSGTFTSQLLSIGSQITSWGPVNITDFQSTGTISYQFGSTTTASVGSITNWQSITNGVVPTVATAPYAAFKAFFTVYNATGSAVLNEFDTNWFEGGVAPGPVSVVYDRRYWISFTTDTTSVPYLNSILVWQRNKSFTLFKGLNAGSFTLWRDLLYFGNSNSTGYVYKFDIGNNDDSIPITSKIITKSYDIGDPIRDKEFSRLYVNYLGIPDELGSYSVFYALNRHPTIYSLGSQSLSGERGQNAFKFWFPMSQLVRGREIQYTVTNTSTEERLRLYGLVSFYEVKEEK